MKKCIGVYMMAGAVGGFIRIALNDIMAGVEISFLLDIVAAVVFAMGWVTYHSKEVD